MKPFYARLFWWNIWLFGSAQTLWNAHNLTMQNDISIAAIRWIVPLFSKVRVKKWGHFNGVIWNSLSWTGSKLLTMNYFLKRRAELWFRNWRKRVLLNKMDRSSLAYMNCRSEVLKMVLFRTLCTRILRQWDRSWQMLYCSLLKALPFNLILNVFTMENA